MIKHRAGAGPSNKNAGGKDAGQIPLPLPDAAPRYTRENFLVAPSNEHAWRAGEAWLVSDEPFLVITGPKGAGKTHLATILADGEGVFCDWKTVSPATVDAPIIVFDDLPPDDPRQFLTTIEDFASAGRRVILSGAGQPAAWAQDLKDLRTRIEAIPRANLGEPDEALLRAVMSKAFADRQVVVNPAVVEFAAPRLARRFSEVHDFVRKIDRLAVTRKQKISITLAREIIDHEMATAED